MAESWVELRVHGVSGTPAESMLDFAHVKQVGGDEFGRFFRRFDEHGVEIPGHDGQVVEAYHWGKFTSGSWSQAIWLLLAPFGIVNAAQFALEPPAARRSKLWYAVAGASLRLVGLSLTVLFVLGTAVITLDLWAWQRIDLSGTVRDRFIAAAALLAPVGLLFMCFSLGRSRLVGSDEPAPRVSDDHAAAEEDAAEDVSFDGAFWSRTPPSDLVRPGFLGGDVKAPALRLLHLAAGLAVMGILGFAPRRTLGDLQAAVGFWAGFVLLALCTVFVIFLGDPERSASVAMSSRRLRSVRAAIQGRSKGVGRALALSGALVVIAAIVHTFAAPMARESTVVHYPGMEMLSYQTMWAAMAGMATLLLANGLLARAERSSIARSGNRRFAPFAHGYACTLLTSLGVFVGVGYIGAFGVTAAKVISTDDVQVQAPELMTRIVYAWGVTLFLLVGLAVIGVVRRRRIWDDLMERASRDFTYPDGLRVPPRWITHVASAMWSARLKNSLVCVFTAFAGLGWILSIATAWELLPQVTGNELWNLPGWFTWLSQPATAADPATAFIVWIGTVALTGLAAALLFLGRTAIAGEGTRRSINVLWDVIAFWPRSAHPFVPPAYSQRAVPDLEKRIRWHLDRLHDPPAQAASDEASTGRQVVLCAHSQGSLLSFAALLRMARDTSSSRESSRSGRDLDEIGFVTFGSQLQVLFSRTFPAYVNLPTIRWLFDDLQGSWRNLYRETDYLAGPVLSWNHRSEVGWVRRTGQRPDADDHSVQVGPDGRREHGPEWRLIDPPLPDRGQRLRPLDRLRRHSDYWTDDAWPDVLDAVRGGPG